MQFLDWLDRHLTSNSHFYLYADELGWPMDYFPYTQMEESGQADVSEATRADSVRQAEPH